MGLDMYLTRKRYINMDERKNLKITGVDVDVEKVQYIEEEVTYWRKANAIHKWFVENVQDGNDDCKSYHVDISELRILRDTISEALETKKYAELLPTDSGFFFGSEEYDEYYVKTLTRTLGELRLIILKAAEDSNWSYYYHSSW